MRVILGRSTSTAPLVRRVSLPKIMWRVLISFRSESKGISPILGSSPRMIFSSTPALRPMSMRANSVGSPIIFPSVKAASLASRAL